MGQALNLLGIVLISAPVGDYDRRVVILTRERGKITAFARGARRPNSSMLASTMPFAFGTFSVYEGKSAYTLVQTEIKEYFLEVTKDIEKAYYGFYFLEFADYYTRESPDEGEMMKLLYVALKALINQKLDAKLVRYIYEMKAMVINGEYPQDVCEDPMLAEATRYTLQVIIATPSEKLFHFVLSDEIFREFKGLQEHIRKSLVDRSFHSLEILEQLYQNPVEK